MGKGEIAMCIGGKTPDVQQPAPTPVYEQAKTDDVVTARRDERKRLKQAMNTRATMLGGSFNGGGPKTLLGQ